MPKRDIISRSKDAQEKIPDAYDLSGTDLADLFNLARQGRDQTLDAIIAAFNYGFIRGNYATIKRGLKAI